MLAWGMHLHVITATKY